MSCLWDFNYRSHNIDPPTCNLDRQLYMPILPSTHEYWCFYGLSLCVSAGKRSPSLHRENSKLVKFSFSLVDEADNKGALTDSPLICRSGSWLQFCPQFSFLGLVRKSWPLQETETESWIKTRNAEQERAVIGIYSIRWNEIIDVKDLSLCYESSVCSAVLADWMHRFFTFPAWASQVSADCDLWPTHRRKWQTCHH